MVGSVFKSWKSMKDGFIKELEMDKSKVKKMTLYRLTVSLSSTYIPHQSPQIISG